MATSSTSITSSRWFKLVWIIPAALAVLAAVILAAKGLRELPAVQSFMADYPGRSELPAGAPVGFPAWLAWQHYLNFFLIVLIIRAGWKVRTTARPPAKWTRNNSGILRTKNPPVRISLDLWFHFSLGWLWIINGALFYVLIFVTGQWTRIVPVHWDVFPNAVSVAVQYASLNWPVDDGWVNYNALQLLAYFVTVFIAAPLAIITGWRMSGAWPRNASRLNRIYPVQLARVVHFPVMLYFVLFIVVHVTLVLATGALRNLNHMFGGSDAESWVGFGIFAVSLVVVIVAWIAARPLLLRPVASLMGSVTR
ncbi:MAG: cytochrome b/b6 domain-containing protein [Pseudolysinimonas sp.]